MAQVMTSYSADTLSERIALPQEGCMPVLMRQEWHALSPTSLLPEFVPGRDTLLTPLQLVSGVDMADKESAEHIFWSTALPGAALESISPVLIRCRRLSEYAIALHCLRQLRCFSLISISDSCRVLELYKNSKLPESTDGRLSAGQVDMAAFVAQSHVKEAIELALNRQVSREHKVVIVPGQSCARDTLNTCVSLLRIPSLQSCSCAGGGHARVCRP